ncbi:hypothetical protein L4C31_16525 [Aliivibrio sifiae]
MYTQKSDWINDHLATSNYYVSDHSSYSSRLGLPTEAKVSLRFFGNIRMGYIFLLAINAPRSVWKSCMNQSVKDHLIQLNKITKHKIPLLIFSDDTPDEFGIVESNWTGRVETGQGLREFFAQFDSDFLSNVGDAKPKNRSYNDSFQAWTISNLSRYLTVNDIDAFELSSIDDSLNVLELKRPKESCKTWLPYTDDAGNYKAGNWMSNNLSNTTFKTIAYNADEKSTIVFLDIRSIQANQLSGSLYRGSIEAIDLRKLNCMKTMEAFSSTRSRSSHYR